jgi:hypothetical protein
MKTDKELKKLINEVFQDDFDDEKRKLVQLLSSENRLSILKDTISVQENMLDIMEPLAKSEAGKIKKSRSSRESKRRIVKEALKMIFIQYPKMKKTVGGVWIKLAYLKDKKIYDPITGKNSKIYTEGDNLFIITEGQKKPLKYTKRSLQPFITALK